MRAWRVWYEYLEDDRIRENVMYVHADSYDEALSKIRKLDPRYCAGQVVNK